MRISIDDGSKLDLRTAKLAEKYELDAIFYWPVEMVSLAYDSGYEPLTYGDALGISQMHKIGSHTITHRRLTKISIKDAEVEIEYSKYMLQNLYDVDIEDFCPPRGYTNEDLTRFTMRHYKRQRLTKGNGLVHIHPNSGANGGVDWREAAEKGVEELWCHSWELEKYNLWEQLDEWLGTHSQL